MTFDRLTQQFLVGPLCVTARSWLAALAVYQPRSLFTLGAFGVSVLCGLASGSVLPYAVKQLVLVPATRVPVNFLMVVSGVVPLCFVLAAGAIGLVVLFGG
jgi:hypothetical protein